MKEKIIKYIEKSKEIVNMTKGLNLESVYNLKFEIESAETLLKSDKKLSVSFLGTFSSGKSTIIKRLTGINLETDANPMTADIHRVEWNGIEIIDTPGLKSTQNQHDSITENYMSKSDLVVWVCEADRLILENHRYILKKLLKDLNKEERLIVVINRLDQVGRSIELEEEYNDICNIKFAEVKRILNELGVERDIPMVAISADPYSVGDGVDIEIAKQFWDEDYCKEVSYFENFENVFNSFISKCEQGTNYLGLYDRINEYIDIVKNDLIDIKIYYENLNELNNNISLQYIDIVENMTLRCNTLISSERKKINDVFEDNFISVVNSISSPTEINKISILSEENIDTVIGELYDSSLEKNILDFKELYKINIDKVKNEQEESYFYKSIEKEYRNIEKKIRVNSYEYIDTYNGSGLDTDLNDIKIKESNNLNVGIINKIPIPTNIGNEVCHKAIYGLGKKVGYKFKPWEAVKMAGNVSKFIKAIPVIFSVIEIVENIISRFNEEKKFKELQEKKQQIINALDDMKKEVFNSISSQLTNYYNYSLDSLRDISVELQNDIEENNKAIEAINLTNHKIRDIRLGNII
ncbi:MAG: dynamin family protein [Paeniclostridium sp.]|nr:dynamin family protein [Paeniclostridium sp.]MBW4861487.1 dynamin family protein [Paeniclostridium sp.]MBW4874851.1 dynamin family protein [Paeniclostridium sp.]